MISRTLVHLFCLASLLFLSACQGTGQVVNFDLQALPSITNQPDSSQNSLVILVEPFQDTRGKDLIGTRTHLWGGETYFNAWNGDISKGMASLATEYLQQRGWKATPHSQGTTSSEVQGDVILTGQVLTFNANAKSRFGSTKIDVQLQVGFEAKNVVDESTVRMVLGSSGTDTVFFFDPDDVKELSTQVLKDLFDQLFRDLKVQDRAFRLQSK